MYQDKTIVCSDCGAEFVFTAGEQEFYAEKGFGEPLRCKECRRMRKNPSARPKQLYEIVCSSCGKVDTVPFEPRHDRAVYCNECYQNSKNI